ncbi:MAG: membrane protein insertion efficiency factor YidD [candidate division WOR-3 bacterium]
MPRVAERALSAFLIFLIKLYKHGVSPLFPSACRFQPSCSQYAITALEKHGPIIGLALSAWRLLRCGPWSDGGYDPVPEPKKKTETNHPGSNKQNDTPDKAVTTYWFEPGALCSREQSYKRGPLKNPATIAFPQGSFLATMRLPDRDQGQTGIFQGFQNLRRNEKPVWTSEPG